jgi:hypothetical protein
LRACIGEDVPTSQIIMLEYSFFHNQFVVGLLNILVNGFAQDNWIAFLVFS